MGTGPAIERCGLSHHRVSIWECACQKDVCVRAHVYVCMCVHMSMCVRVRRDYILGSI